MGRLEEKFTQLYKRRWVLTGQRMGLIMLCLIILVSTSVWMLMPAYTLVKATYCGLEEHSHDESCYMDVLTCPLEEGEEHMHDESCYEHVPGCEKPEHEHTLECYSDPGADLETESDWMGSFPAFSEDMSASECLVESARSQLGYTESSLNYSVDEDGEVHGWTRYGMWADDPYADWNELFAAFCLYYAGVGEDDFPRERDAWDWQQTLADRGLYEDHGTSPYFPSPGDLAFYVNDENELCTGIIVRADQDAGVFSAVCGDVFDQVCELDFDVTQERLLGFGALPASLRPAESEETDAEPQDIPGQEGVGNPIEETGKTEQSDNTGEVTWTVEQTETQPIQNDPEVQDVPGQEEAGILGGEDAKKAEEAGIPGEEDTKKAEEEEAGIPGEEARKAEKKTGIPAEEADRTGQADSSKAAAQAVDDSAGHAAQAEEQSDSGVELTTELEDFRISVKLSSLPEGEYHLFAKPVPLTEEKLRQVEESQTEELEDGVCRRAQVDASDLMLFDLSILDENGGEYQPGEEVRVSVTRTRSTREEALPAVVHFSGKKAESLDVEAEKDGFGFDTDGFSLYAFAFTVDFYYEGYEYHLPGGSELRLSRLFELLAIDRDAAGAESVRFSDPSLLSVERLEGDWLLTSLAPFDTDEILIVTMQGGDTYSISVTDAKNYNFSFNVNDPAAGCAYSASTNYGESIILAVQNSGVSSGSVRPRSSDVPTNGHLSASDGYEFRFWRVDGYRDFGRGAEEPASYSDRYSISPAVGVNGVEDRATTFTACFAPSGQYIITFDQSVDGGEYGTLIQAGARSYDYLDAAGSTGQVLFCYSGDGVGEVAEAGTGGVFEGWYDTSSGGLVCSTPWFIPPADLDHEITVRARFRAAQRVTVTYLSYNTQNSAQGVGNITIHGRTDAAKSVSEQIYEEEVPSGALAGDYPNYTFVCWRDESNVILTRDKDLNLYGGVRKDTFYRAEYLATRTQRILFRSNDRSFGSVMYSNSDKTDDWIPLEVTSEGRLNLKRSATAVPAENFRFDHWELNGQRFSGDTASSIRGDLGVFPDAGTNVQELTAVFQPICRIQYDLSVLQQVGNNSADYQHWQDEPWCPKDVRVDRDGLTELGEDLYQETVDFGTEFTFPDLTQQTRISQTNNGYNLLTHTFKGWRIEGDESNTVYRPGQTVNIYGQCKLTAVWDAYFDEKNGYYGASDSKIYRYNTNTCGFFVRLFDTVFDIGDVNTYTDCLFTTRLIGDPLFEGDGRRDDFSGDSVASNRADIDSYDNYLRTYAASGIIANESGSYNGSVMRLELPFPSDEFIFGRIRQWNASQIENNTGRQIQINGHLIPQEQLNSDYYDLRWYVLKDQENSWHIDGMLIPKYAKLVVTKSFVGDPAAIENIKNGSFYIGVDEEKDNTSGSGKEQYQLNLQPWSVSNPTGYRFIDSSGRYVWVIDDLLPLKSYYVAEHSYTAASPYTTTKSWQVYNSTQSSLSGNSYRLQVEHVYPYADSVWIDGIQTVAFTNHYTRPRELSLIKLDSTTKHPLSSVPFQFVLYANQGDGTIVEIKKDYTTEPNGRISVTFPTELTYNGQTVRIPSKQEGVFDGRHRFSITEKAHEGYRLLPGPITGTVIFYDDRDAGVELDDNSNPLFYVEKGGGEGTEKGAIIYVENEPETVQVSVSKSWINGASRPVNMQLLQNGVPVIGKNVTLGAEADRVSSDPAHNSSGWTYTWTELPAYVDGTAAAYTVREEWIGLPGGSDSYHYNTSADADGYADYIVSQTRTTDENGNVSAYVVNTPDGGQVVFSKIDDLNQAVPGAEFTVYRDDACAIPIRAEDFRDGTDKESPSRFVSDSKGIVTIPALKTGTYYMKETGVPLGWTLKDDRIYTLTFEGGTGTLTSSDPVTGQTSPVTQIENPVYAAEVTIRKTVSGTEQTLSGTVFSLHAAEADGSMKPAPVRDKDQLITGPDGLVSLGSLRRGVYYLVEETAPPGYEKLNEPIRLTVPDSSSARITAIKAVSRTGLAVSAEGVVTVGNSPGVSLPVTGFRGEALLKAAGTALLIPASLYWSFLLLLCLKRLGQTKGGDPG